MTAATNPAGLLAVATQVAREAADLARQHRARGLGDIGTKSTDTDLVTAADRAVERLVVDRLRELRPGDAVLGEEYGASAGAETKVRWLVDPIDGTVNYVYGLGHYAVSMAAEVDGTVVAGVVRDVDSGDEWSAARGGGAWRDGQRLRCSTVGALDLALVATGFGYNPAQRAHQAAVLAQILPLVRDVRRFGAASLDLCYVAEGRVDIYYEKGLNPWDYAAGALVAAEAGLTISGLRGAPAGPTMLMAAPPQLYQPLHDLLVSVDADGGP